MRVLVIEDERIARTSIVKILRNRGHHVTECEAAEPALALHRAMPFPLILLDWMLPGMDGLEFCRELRQIPEGESPVIVLVTGRDRPEHLIQGLDAGIDDYLIKPVDNVTLTTRLTFAERMVVERARQETTEEALLSSESNFRALVEGMSDAIVAHQRGRIVYVNPSLLALLGYKDSSELLGRAYLDLMHESYFELARGRIAEAVQSGNPAPPAELGLVKIGGQIVTMEEVAIPLELDGSPAVAAVLRDVSERKRLEQQLMLADRMVSVGTLAAGIAHEINNPLAYVLRNIQFIGEELDYLKGTIPSDKLSTMRGLLDEAGQGADRVRVIVRDLKGFSRAQDEGDTTTDLHSVLDGSISMAWNEIRHRARLMREYSSVPPVVGNEAKLGQVVLNLLVNAAQALPVGKATEHKITVRTSVVDKHVLVEVEDTGCGIPQDVLPRIFDPFFTTKPVGVGMGLGLSICHSIVSATGGELSVHSEVDKGTCFTIKLPVATVPSLPRPRSSLPRSISQSISLNILVVDDEPAVGRALQRTLRGHQVTLALSGREAMGYLRSPDSFDIIFCDLMMAEVSGMELYEHVRQTTGQHTRFAFVTGGAFTPQAKEFLATIPNPILEKPFDVDEIHDLIRNVRTMSPPTHLLATATDG